MQCIRKGFGRSLGAVSVGEQGIDIMNDIVSVVLDGGHGQYKHCMNYARATIVDLADL